MPAPRFEAATFRPSLVLISSEGKILKPSITDLRALVTVCMGSEHSGMYISVKMMIK